ncbi:MAG TPA: helix-hairpin-helix domain-containing protein, partial [Halococcus sp.]|nr:helix-hairpin-helix domain-containing protein [Halococcus sp.]
REAGYESVQEVREAEQDALTEIDGIGECRAAQIIESATAVLNSDQQDTRAVADGGTPQSTDANGEGGGE